MFGYILTDDGFHGWRTFKMFHSRCEYTDQKFQAVFQLRNVYSCFSQTLQSFLRRGDSFSTFLPGLDSNDRLLWRHRPVCPASITRTHVLEYHVSWQYLLQSWHKLSKGLSININSPSTKCYPPPPVGLNSKLTCSSSSFVNHLEMGIREFNVRPNKI